nr:uncharacterized protein LOC106836618 isoform X10 [Equus asinus]
MKAVTSSWRDFTHHVPFEAVRSTAQSAARSPVRIPAAVPWPSPRFPAGDPAAGTGRDRPTARLLRPASSPASALLPLLHLRSASRYSKPCDSGSCDSRQSGAAERQLGIDFCTLPHHYDNGSVGSIFNAVGRDSVKGMKKKNVDADAGHFPGLLSTNDFVFCSIIILLSSNSSFKYKWTQTWLVAEPPAHQLCFLNGTFLLSFTVVIL